MSRKRKTNRASKSDLAIAKLALLAGALEVAGAIINLLATIIDKIDSISARTEEGRRKPPDLHLYCIRLGR